MKDASTFFSSQNFKWKSQLIWAAALTAVMAVSLLFPAEFVINRHLSVHVLLETVSASISFVIFYIGLRAYDSYRPGNFLILSCGFMAVGTLDLLHLLSPGGTHKAIFFWQMSRLIAASALTVFTAVPVHPIRKKPSRYLLYAAAAAAAIAIAWFGLFHSDLYPQTIMEGQGFTPFKASVDYALALIHIFNILLLAAKTGNRRVIFNSRHMVAAIIAMTASQLCFTLYHSAHDSVNLLGHIYKILALIFVFKAIYRENIDQPMRKLEQLKLELQRQFEQVHTAFQSIYDAVVIADSEHRVDFMNRNAQYLTGWSMKEAAGRPIKEIINIVDGSKQQSIDINKDIQSGHLLTKLHRMLEVELTASPIVSASGDITGHVIVFRDIGDRLLIQKARDRLLAIMEETTDLMAVVNVSGTIEYFNKAALRMLDIGEGEDISSMLLRDAHSPSLRGKLDAALAEAEAKGVWHGESVLLARTGKLIPVSQVIVAHKRPDGTLDHYSTVARDITDWKRAQEKNALATEVFENVSEGVMLTDRNQSILYVNPSFTELTGYGAEEVLGARPSMLSSGWHNKEFYDRMWSEINHTGKWHGEIWNKKKNGTLYAEELSISAVKDASGEITHYVAIFNDITVRKDLEAKIHYQAQHDILTGLPNRLLLQDRIVQAIQHVQNSNRKAGVLFIDLDRFKRINDSLGHSVGDKLLQAIGERLKQCIRASDTVARIGGDELIVLLPNVLSEDDCKRVAEKIIHVMGKPILIEGNELYVTCSIGISMCPADGSDPDTLIQKADSAMYRAKMSGRNKYRFHDLSCYTGKRPLRIESQLRKAFDNEEFVLHYQPKVNIQTNEIVGMEALIRWQSKDYGLVPPNEFIPVAEDTGLIVSLDRWVLHRACLQTKQWRDLGLRSLKISVNLSMLQFQQDGFFETIEQILHETGLPPSLLDIELTESTMMNILN